MIYLMQVCFLEFFSRSHLPCHIHIYSKFQKAGNFCNTYPFFHPTTPHTQKNMISTNPGQIYAKHDVRFMSANAWLTTRGVPTEPFALGNAALPKTVEPKTTTRCALLPVSCTVLSFFGESLTNQPPSICSTQFIQSVV